MFENDCDVFSLPPSPLSVASTAGFQLAHGVGQLQHVDPGFAIVM